MNDKGIMTSGVIGNLRITTDLIKERDSLQHEVERLKLGRVDQHLQMSKLASKVMKSEVDAMTIRRALEKAADAQDGCPTPMTERSCPPKTTCQECWIEYYKEEKE